MAPQRVLIVEDDPDHRQIIRTLLAHQGYGVLEAGTGNEAVAVAREHRPQLILMDARLPVLDGWEATRRLKSDPATREVPVVMLTAYVRDADRARSLTAGCDDYLAKPCALEEVVATVRRWIGPP